MGILAWLIVGFFAGLIARAIVPGRQGMGLLMTAVLGMVGSVIGGLIGAMVWHRNAGDFTPGGLFLSVLGAIVVLFAFGSFRRPMRV